MNGFDVKNFKWIREPKQYDVKKDCIMLVTDPNTDLWQRTYYGFRNDSAPVFQMDTEEKYFSFTVKTEFFSKFLFEQCGVIIYLDSDNWFKASIEYENEKVSKLGSVVTNLGYSDWATTDISSDIRTMYYRLSRRESDYLVETSENGIDFKQMRIFHLFNGAGKISFGLYACSPLNSSFKVKFSELSLTECVWKAHQG
jgi:regulation of enolase protein 1 (concanavalin A-like superfamily)